MGIDGYAFHHALGREAIEASMMPAERERWHAAVAEALRPAAAGSADPVLLGRVAHHWWHAKMPRPAIEAAITAGHVAEAAYALHEAAGFTSGRCGCGTARSRGCRSIGSIC